MAVDISQFHDMFFEECRDGLEIMETGLLQLASDSEKTSVIHDIFRAAHSIKGGAGTFGFQGVSEFTHDLETLLDLVREGKCNITQPMIEVMLQSVDCLRIMIDQLRNHQELDCTKSDSVSLALRAILNHAQGKTCDKNAGKAVHDETHIKNDRCSYQIKFKPSQDIFRSGNDPYRIIRELSEFGQLTSRVILDDLVDYEKINSTECYISWEFLLEGDALDKNRIEDVFEWVIDESDIEINAVLQAIPTVVESKEQIKETSKQQLTAVASEVESAVQKSPVEKLPAEISSSKIESKADNSKSSDSRSIRVNIDKVDALINMVGEMVITQSMLSQLSKDLSQDRYHDVISGLAQLAANTRELQETVMSLRMMPLSFAFNRFPRLVRDLGNQLNKKVNLLISGEQTELDKTVLEKLTDPLTHIIRNAMDHGLETTEERRAAGKAEEGLIELKAYYEGGSVVIRVSDDGRGLNYEKIRKKAESIGLIREDAILTPEELKDLILRPGFSTADQISDLSGRGVGLDVVKQNIKALNGTLDMQSEPSKGTTFTIRLPLTLAIVDGQLIRVRDSIYVIPLVAISESLQMSSNNINCLAGSVDVYRLRNENIPIVYLSQLFGFKRNALDETVQTMMVVVESNDKKLGLVVDELLDQQQVVIKSLETNYQSVKGVSGATILGDGTVAMICDIHDIFSMSAFRPDFSPGNTDAADNSLAA